MIMSNTRQVVKNQHYVWRKYLTAWSNKNIAEGKRRIYVLRKHPCGRQPTFESALLTNVASEKFFYDISGHKPIDKEVMKKFLDYMQRRDPIKLEINFQLMNKAALTRDFLENYVMSPIEEIDNKHHFLKKLQDGDLSFYKDSTAQQVMNLLKDHLIRCLNGAPVNYSDEKLFEEFQRGMITIKNEPDIKFEFNQFFWMQYFRSKKMHDNQKIVIEKFKQIANLPNLDNAFYVNMILIFIAMKVALNITQNIPSCLQLYKNYTATQFITADTPIVNLDYHRLENKTNDSRMYYPVSPNTAVILQTGRGATKNSIHEIHSESISIVKEFNNSIYEQASNEVYASNEQVLQNL